MFTAVLHEPISDVTLEDKFDCETEDDVYAVAAESYPDHNVVHVYKNPVFIIAGTFCDEDRDYLFFNLELGWVSRNDATRFECVEIDLPLGATGIAFE
jgi:hypothetical protein